MNDKLERMRRELGFGLLHRPHRSTPVPVPAPRAVPAPAGSTPAAPAAPVGTRRRS